MTAFPQTLTILAAAVPSFVLVTGIALLLLAARRDRRVPEGPAVQVASRLVGALGVAHNQQLAGRRGGRVGLGRRFELRRGDGRRGLC